MDKFTYILKRGFMGEDFYAKVSVIEKVVDKSLFEDLYIHEPFVCKLILDKFKTYLEDPEFDKLERQLLLIKFLKNNYPLELSRDVVEYVQNCNYSEDYTRAIMEWNYECSDFIKQYNLRQYDASQLAFDKEMKSAFDFHLKQKNKELDIVTDITKSLLGMEDNNEKR